EERTQVVNGLLDRLGGFQRVGTDNQLNRNTRGRLAIVQGAERRVLGAQLDPSHIPQAHLGAVAVDLQQDVAELFGRFEAGLADDGGVELLTGYRRSTTQLAAGDLHVLTGDGVADIHRGQLIAIEFRRVQPDAHGIGRAEHLEVTHPGGPGDRVLQGGDDEVREV